MTLYCLSDLKKFGAVHYNPDVGLDYASAREATPRWFGVSFGNGNDGVSHMFPGYYVRCTDPWELARIAMISSFKEEWQTEAAKTVEVDGEEDYTIFATIYDRLDEEVEYDEDGDCESWSSINGAWAICEVFPTDDVHFDADANEWYADTNAPLYESMEDAFNARELKRGELVMSFSCTSRFSDHNYDRHGNRRKPNDHNEPTWENQLWHARQLLIKEGWNALYNPHGDIGRQCKCGECFCCAAYQVCRDDEKQRHHVAERMR